MNDGAPLPSPGEPRIGRSLRALIGQVARDAPGADLAWAEHFVEHGEYGLALEAVAEAAAGAGGALGADTRAGLADAAGALGLASDSAVAALLSPRAA